MKKVAFFLVFLMFCNAAEPAFAEDHGKVFSMAVPAEPTISEVQEMAVAYAEVNPEKIYKWRRGARWKAVMPKVSVSFSESYGDNIDIYKSSSTSYIVTGPRERDNEWSVDLTWDLSDLVWNSEQTGIDVRSKLMVQLREEILYEVTRFYFERKRLLLEIADEGPGAGKKTLRVEELTAQIDALTGGGFSDGLRSWVTGNVVSRERCQVTSPDHEP